MFSGTRKLLFLSVIVVLLTTAVSACSTQSQSSDLHMMSMDEMPADVQSAPPTVQTAHQFSAANPDIMKDIPCYCGCGKMGHTSNYACYVAEVAADGKITYDPHALGCSICVDITQDTMRLLKQDKSVQEIRAYVDSTYSKFGPSNMP